MLSQSKIVKYFDQCQSCNDPALAIEEVLSAYVVWKLIRGSSSARTLIKLRYLVHYLRATERGWVLSVGRDVFGVLSNQLLESGGTQIGTTPATTPPGLSVWNALRRAAARRGLTASSQYGGPIQVQPFLSNSYTLSIPPSSRPISEELPPPTLDGSETSIHERRFGSAPDLVTTSSTMEAPEYTAEDREALPLYEPRGVGREIHQFNEVA